jgi:hypothetical protein
MSGGFDDTRMWKPIRGPLQYPCIDLAAARHTHGSSFIKIMKTRKTLALSLVLALSTYGVSPVMANVNDVARAVAIVQRMVELNKRFEAYDVKLVAPEPINGTSGKFLLPVNEQGQLTGWAEKAVNAQVGNIAGEQAGAAASRGLASAIPGGGLASGFLKKKGKEVGATAALGGKEFIRSSSSLSFNTSDDYAVYLHAKLAGTPEYQKALTAAIALYPDLETGYDAAVTAAYENAKRVALAEKAAAELAAKKAAEAKAAADAAAAKKAAEAAAASTTTTTTVTTTTVTTATAPAGTSAAPAAAPAAPAAPATH